MKTKLVVRPGNITIRFDEQSFFSTILGFNHCWDYKHNIKFLGQKIVNISATHKMHLKSDCLGGSILEGCRQPILYSLVLD